MQECSKHRSTIVPPPNSPKEMWLLDILGPDPKTQYLDQPLQTRDVRKAKLKLKLPKEMQPVEKSAKLQNMESCPACGKQYPSEDLMLHFALCI